MMSSQGRNEVHQQMDLIKVCPPHSLQEGWVVVDILTVKDK